MQPVFYQAPPVDYGPDQAAMDAYLAAGTQRAMALGANAYITKPIQAPQVIAKVQELLDL